MIWANLPYTRFKLWFRVFEKSINFVYTNQVTMDEFILKFGLLEPVKKQEVLDFLEFLLSKQKKEKIGNFQDYKKRLLKVSVWSKEDILEMEENSKKLNQWRAPEW